MPHINDGQLHAYLDGALAQSDPEYAEIHAHLATCADCRARLEHERVVRADANAILARAVPHTTAMPSFEELVARKAARQEAAVPAPKAKRRIPTVQLALAASLVLAMGAALLTTRIARSRIADEDAAITQSAKNAATSPSVAATAPPPSPAVSAPAVEPAPAPARVAQAAGGAARSAEVPSPLAMQRNRPAQNEADFSGEGKEGGAAKGSAASIARGTVAAIAPAAAPPTPAAGAVADEAANAASSAERALGARSNVAEAGASGAAPARAMMKQSAERWVTVARAAAESRLGSSVFTVQGLTVVSYEVPASPDQRIVRVNQTLASGEPLQLIEQGQAAAARTRMLFDRARDKPAVDEIQVTGAQTDRRADAAAAAAPAAPPAKARAESVPKEEKKTSVTSTSAITEVTVVRGPLQIQGRASLDSLALRQLIERAQ